MWKYNRYLQSKGSITVESCVILPVFLSLFFLLLAFIKFTCTGMLLDYAVNESAKEIAAAAYPISFINEMEDEKIQEFGKAKIPTIEEELEKLEKKLTGGNSGSLLNLIVADGPKGTDVASTLEDIIKDYRKGIIGSAIDVIKPSYWNIKSAARYAIAGALIKGNLQSPMIDPENIRLRIAEFPQGKEEYNTRSDSIVYESLGLTPGKDFCNDDVVLQLEYDYSIKLPFFRSIDIKMVHTAVERGWIKGSSGVLTEKDEGLDLGTEAEIVYITRTGIRYHRGDCRYLRKSRIPVEIGEATGRGYTPCKICRPLNLSF